MFFNRLMYMVSVSLFMLVIGFCMQQSLNSLFYILALNCWAFTVVHAIRKFMIEDDDDNETVWSNEKELY